MKSFIEYLVESKKVYEFKIKLAGDYSESKDEIKSALAKFKVDSISDAMRTPVQETHWDFPNHRNVNMTIFDVVLLYPSTSLEIQNTISDALNISRACVKVRNKFEQQEEELNSENCPNHPSGEALLNQPYEKTNHQDLVGSKKAMSLLKELGKEKHQGTQYKGVNDQLLAKRTPFERGQEQMDSKSKTTVSPVGSKQNKIPDPYQGK